MSKQSFVVRTFCRALSVAALAMAIAPTPVSAQAATASAASLLSPFQQKALLAFSPSATAFSRVTLSGTVVHTVNGKSSTGSVTLVAGTDGYVSESWNVSGANNTISKSAFGSDRACTVSLNGGKAVEPDGMECARQVPWFAPWVGLPVLEAGIGTVTESAGEPGSTRLTFPPLVEMPTNLSPKALADLQRVMRSEGVDVLYDSTTALPSGMHYLDLLNSETSNAIDQSIVYSSYSLDQGLVFPHRIQRYVLGSLESDITITSIVLN